MKCCCPCLRLVRPMEEFCPFQGLDLVGMLDQLGMLLSSSFNISLLIFGVHVETVNVVRCGYFWWNMINISMHKERPYGVQSASVWLKNVEKKLSWLSFKVHFVPNTSVAVKITTANNLNHIHDYLFTNYFLLLTTRISRDVFLGYLCLTKQFSNSLAVVARNIHQLSAVWCFAGLLGWKSQKRIPYPNHDP